MKVDVEIQGDSIGETPLLAKKAEELGFDGLWVNETKHDPFVLLALASSATRKISVGSSVALAFTRSPTSTAYSAWDLQAISGGRLILGLGSQVKGHIERRFGMRWESPAPKMQEVIAALRAIWANWQSGTKLDFQGTYFKLDLMTPFFSPPPVGSPTIPIYVAGVNRGMCHVAGESGDGLLVHPLHTERYLKEVIRPALSVGAAKGGKGAGDVVVAASIFAAVGNNEDEIRRARNQLRGYIAFYGSTRTYRRVMELHGWGDVCDRLHRFSVTGEWERMAAEIGDEVLGKFVVEGTWGEIGGVIQDRYRGLADRVRIYLPFDGREKWKELASGFSA